MSGTSDPILEEVIYSSHDAYARAIDILVTNTADYRQLAIELAKRHPQEFIEAYEASCRTLSERQQSRKVTDIDRAKEIAMNGNITEAVKLVRKVSGVSLAEAKRVVQGFVDAGKTASGEKGTW